MLTLLVRVTVDLPINVLVTWVAEFMAHKLKLEGALQALRAVPSQLHVNHLGARIEDGGKMVSSYPDRAMFLLSRGPLGEEYQGHQGWVWQCGNCGAANTKRGNVIRQKCKSRSARHKFFFDDQPDKLGDHPRTKAGKPLYLPQDSEPAILPRVQVSTSLSLAIAIVAFSPFTYSA